MAQTVEMYEQRGYICRKPDATRLMESVQAALQSASPREGLPEGVWAIGEWSVRGMETALAEHDEPTKGSD